MTRLLSARHPVRHAHNANALRGAYGDAAAAVLTPEGFARARAAVAAWPGYAPTPLHDLPGLAAAAGVASIRYKDESGRFGLGSFKALGGAYAVQLLLAGAVERRLGLPAGAVTAAELESGRHRDITRHMTVCCATDGNHGRSVAWGARRFGCACVIHLHEKVSPGRQQAIEAFGARIVRTAGTYDDSVRRAAEDAAANGWTVISDTSWPGYTDIPRDVMQGYTVMAAEAIEQAAGAPPPTHVFIPGGVGGLAAAVIARGWAEYGAARPRMLTVEPARAACILASVAAGRPTAVEGDLETIMAGLSCGEISPVAWEVLRPGLDDALSVPDAAAEDCMRLLADGVGGDTPVVAGESAVAGLAGMLAALADPPLAAALGLGRTSRVLLYGSEGATDPETYRRIVGRPATAVAARARG